MFCAETGTKKEPFSGSFFHLFRSIRAISVYRNDLFLVISTAVLAYTMRNHKLAALAALYQRRSTHFPVRSPLVASSFGRFVLRAN